MLDANVLGYVLYDQPRDLIKVRHLCVAQNQRGAGIARELVDAVSARHQERRGIELDCRRDYVVNSMWPHLSFVPLGEHRGRSEASWPLTIWFRSHRRRHLFTSVPEDDPDDRVAVALDHKVVIHLLSQRETGEESIRLDALWLAEHIVLCVTDEVDQEINRSDDAARRE